ncbi:MAG TPA: DsbA family protein, partial [Solirubrobacteraceae bacterium]
LTRLAADVGLDPEETADVLAGDRYAAEVRDDERTAMALGVNAVPFFVVDRKFGAAGAQPPETLGKLLHRGWDDRPVISVVTGGEACGPDGC